MKSLEQALKLFTRVEVLDGDNKYRCEGCKKLSRAKKQFSVDKAPKRVANPTEAFRVCSFREREVIAVYRIPVGVRFNIVFNLNFEN